MGMTEGKVWFKKVNQKEKDFIERIEEIRILAKNQQNVVSKEQVDELFSDFAKEKEQMEHVYAFLKEQRIGIGVPQDMDAFLTEEEKSYLEYYMEELAMLPPMTDGIKQATIISALAGEREAKNKLIQIFLPQVVDIAKLYTGQGLYLEDLIGEGNIALVSAVEMLNCVEETKEVEPLLVLMVMNAMEEAIMQEESEQKEEKKAAKLVEKISELALELSEILNRNVTPKELVQESKYTMKDIKKAVFFSGGEIEHLDCNTIENEDNADESEV